MYVCVEHERQNQKLFDAARDGNLTDARAAIENEANVNWINRNVSSTSICKLQIMLCLLSCMYKCMYV